MGPSHEDDDLVPGTIRLFGGSESEEPTVISLVPTPSTDPRDPLTWSQPRKMLHLFSVSLVVLAVGMAGNALYSIYTPLSEGSGISIDQLIQGVGYLYLAVGFFPLITQPFALAYGKRVVYLVTLAASAGLTFWAPHITNNGLWILNRLLMGLATAPSFTLAEASIADVFFAHERSFPLAVYVLVLYVSALVAPLFGAYIFPTLGFTGVLYLGGGFCALSLIFCIFFLEETNFDRPVDLPSSVHEDSEKDMSVKSDPIGQVVAAEPAPSRWSQLQLFYPHPHARAILWDGFIQPIKMLRLPIVMWAALQFINQLASSVLASPPYNWDTGPVGLAYISPILISIPSSLLFGVWSDRFSLAMARKNNGISEPEHKLWLLLPVLIINPLGLIMMGCGAQHGLHWIVYVLGMGILNLGSFWGTDICLFYLFDCYHDLVPRGGKAAVPSSTPYLLSILMPSMTMTFGINYAIAPWTTNLGGLQNFGLTAAAVSTVCTLTVIPMIMYGKELRRRGAPLYTSIIER